MTKEPSPFVEFLHFLGVAAIVVLCVAFVVWQFGSPNTTLARTVRKIKPILTNAFKRNNLHRCHHCDRYQRRYQLHFWQIKEGKKQCVHCLSHFAKSYTREANYVNIVSDPDSWTDTHKDCFKIGFFDYIKLRKAVIKVRDFKAAERIDRRLEEYNRISKDSQWMERLQKVKADE